MTFAVRLLPIDEVSDHPNADRLSVCKVRDYTCISAKLEDGSHRFEAGDRVIYVPEGAVLTEEQLREHGFWGHNKQQDREMGLLSGRDGNRVKPLQLRKIMSTGLLWPQPAEFADLPDNTCVADRLGITRFVPEVPEALLKVATPLFDAKVSYDIARLRMYPSLLEGDDVAITEKLEGECLILTYLGGARHEGLFADGLVANSTKGLSEKGLVFLDNEQSRKIPAVQAAFAGDLVEKLLALAADCPNAKIQLFCEAVGPGVKKLHYAGTAPFPRAFDLRINGVWQDHDFKHEMFTNFGIDAVPVLYRGPYDRAIVEELREGPTTIGGGHIREGVVVTATGDQSKRTTELGDELRPILKLHSDVFLRKFNINDDDA
ncbi:RNA ligase family protein [Erythrobacter aureus]|uniref:RNA ligase domain-containing protein n=1 Tax=Erythrobacter aureus TaxID=2182384 RepID=A0A345YJ44_9SPHN|nr:RNA ligase family protein [Erythrobacter aureus]AXK43946.1 hypothetical protein DVR09_15950 [Erythrobacter aureus]